MRDTGRERESSGVQWLSGIIEKNDRNARGTSEDTGVEICLTFYRKCSSNYNPDEVTVTDMFPV